MEESQKQSFGDFAKSITPVELPFLKSNNYSIPNELKPIKIERNWVERNPFLYGLTMVCIGAVLTVLLEWLIL